MADETANTTQSGHNISKMEKAAADAIKRVTGLKDKRGSINDEIAAIRSDLEAKGIHKKAFDMALQYLNMDPDKREGFDIAYEIVRKASGLPINPQLDMFQEEAAEGANANG